MTVESVATHRVHGGTLAYCRHESTSTGGTMKFSVFMPPGPGPHPALIWLSGLTCTEDNFTTKAGAYRAAAAAGLAIVAPDTSPRGEGVADDAAYDLGQGAGFYVDAEAPPWAPHFKMETYVAKELIELIGQSFPIELGRIGVSGHSMGGHGALTLALRHPQTFRSVSAFSPIVAPSQVPWGRKAFEAYLGPDEASWAVHDATGLMGAGAGQGRFDDILIDQGTADPFLERELQPQRFADACARVGQAVTLRMQAGYDHSYFFIASFIDDHVAWHARRL
jgi:S-formylglutathione hydrolase